MADSTLVRQTGVAPPRGAPPHDGDCTLVLFGASGDLTRRLLTPAIYNLACDGLLPRHFAIVGVARDTLSVEQFRQHLTEGIQKFKTRPTLDQAVWDRLAQRIYYTHGTFEDPATYARLAELLTRVEAEQQTGGNLLHYLATPPVVFATIAEKLATAGLARRPNGWTRLIVEKPFGHDLASATLLNRAMLTHWAENQLYRIDHYLGKETVQNLLAFRFSNGAFEPLWNKNHVDHVQINVAETVGVETRGDYYDKTGVLRDMIQNHMFQMLAYVCMEPPSSFRADAVRNEKSKLLEAVRLLKPADVARNVVRGQYGPVTKLDGTVVVKGYRQEDKVAADSSTETFAAMRLFVDNWRWDGVPIYLRSGKSLWKRGTEIVVQFKKAPDALFRETPAGGNLDANRLIFHIQPDQGIEFRFHAKTPGPAMDLQKVNMRFDYKEAFEAARGTGYEVLLFNAMAGDATLFSRTDLVEAAWRIAQPMLDAWSASAPADFPNYQAGTWGPPAAYDLVKRDGRQWVEVVNRGVLEKVPLFHDADPVFLHNLALMLQPAIAPAGEPIVRHGDAGDEMYFICRGCAEAVDGAGKVLSTMGEGDFFGELSLLFSRPRSATVRAVTPCDLFVLGRTDFEKVLRDYPKLSESLQECARVRYGVLAKS
jgi:glucose-6-phosphate 1-dehydrogenase